MKKFSIRFRELRAEAGVSMEELANAIDVSNAAVCKWENDEAEPKASSLIRLSEFFDCSIDYLVGKTDEYQTGNFSASPVHPFKPTQKERELIENYRSLNPNMKIVLEETLKVWNKL